MTAQLHTRHEPPDTSPIQDQPAATRHAASISWFSTTRVLSPSHAPAGARGGCGSQRYFPADRREGLLR